MGQLIQFRAPIRDTWGFSNMGKMELFEEVVRFQKDRSASFSLTPDLIDRGRHLFTTLEKLAETPELRMLCQGYLKQLDVSNFITKNGLDN